MLFLLHFFKKPFVSLGLCVFKWLQVLCSAKRASYFYLDEWAGDIKVDGQLVKITVIGNVETGIGKKSGCHSLGQTVGKLEVLENEG